MTARARASALGAATALWASIASGGPLEPGDMLVATSSIGPVCPVTRVWTSAAQGVEQEAICRVIGTAALAIDANDALAAAVIRQTDDVSLVMAVYPRRDTDAAVALPLRAHRRSDVAEPVRGVTVADGAVIVAARTTSGMALLRRELGDDPRARVVAVGGLLEELDRPLRFAGAATIVDLESDGGDYVYALQRSPSHQDRVLRIRVSTGEQSVAVGSQGLGYFGIGYGAGPGGERLVVATSQRIEVVDPSGGVFASIPVPVELGRPTDAVLLSDLRTAYVAFSTGSSGQLMRVDVDEGSFTPVVDLEGASHRLALSPDQATVVLGAIPASDVLRGLVARLRLSDLAQEPLDIPFGPDDVATDASGSILVQRGSENLDLMVAGEPELRRLEVEAAAPFPRASGLAIADVPGGSPSQVVSRVFYSLLTAEDGLPAVASAWFVSDSADPGDVPRLIRQDRVTGALVTRGHLDVFPDGALVAAGPQAAQITRIRPLTGALATTTTSHCASLVEGVAAAPASADYDVAATCVTSASTRRIAGLDLDEPTSSRNLHTTTPGPIGFLTAYPAVTFDASGRLLVGLDTAVAMLSNGTLELLPGTYDGVNDLAIVPAPPLCGNHQTERGEACDGSQCCDDCGFRNDGSCCVTGGPCGDGVRDPGEACDDADRGDGDGCSRGCAIEQCYQCVGAPGATSTCSTLPNQTPCVDGDEETTNDVCTSGVCLGTTSTTTTSTSTTSSSSSSSTTSTSSSTSSSSTSTTSSSTTSTASSSSTSTTCPALGLDAVTCQLDALAQACGGEPTPPALGLHGRIAKIRSVLARGLLAPSRKRAARAKRQAREQLRALASKAARLGTRGRLSHACAAQIGSAASIAIGAIGR